MGWRLDLELVTAGPDDVMPWGTWVDKCTHSTSRLKPILAGAGAGPQDRMREDAEVCGQQAAYLGRVLPFTNDRSSCIACVAVPRRGISVPQRAKMAIKKYLA
jgi:hypothetical protein